MLMIEINFLLEINSATTYDRYIHIEWEDNN